MPVPFIVVIALAAAAALALVVRALLPAKRASVPLSESILLEEAVITEPVAPGMEGRAELRRQGAKPLPLRVRATDASQVFARGSRVRIIDLQGGLCVIESADEEHLAR
jgi:hypothetical protein